MRINHNVNAMVTEGALFKANRGLSTSLERLSTGLRINRASDDAAGLAISENLRTQVRGAAQAKRNAMDATAALNIAEGAANEVSEILQRMRELAIQSSNDTLTDTERGYTDQEFSALIEEIDRIADVTNYNGMALISDSTASGRFGQGSVGSAVWIDANDTAGTDSITVTIDTLSTATGGGIGVTGLSLAAQSSAASAIGTLDTAIDSVNSMRADIGAVVNRLEHAVNNLIVSETNQAAAESQIRDADFAHETSQFVRNQILTQSAMAMLSQANMVPQSVLGLVAGG
ncbi:MAG: flagellin [Chitinivibrionales bacterium]|nr:flagellin [Chitinivibrionales bacterium]MBD3394144.1 flagellin [Chitinivibrionales bacterium]